MILFWPTSDINYFLKKSDINCMHRGNHTSDSHVLKKKSITNFIIKGLQVDKRTS